VVGSQHALFLLQCMMHTLHVMGALGAPTLPAAQSHSTGTAAAIQSSGAQLPPKQTSRGIADYDYRLFGVGVLVFSTLQCGSQWPGELPSDLWMPAWE
jgi:hypothetical protein